MKRAQSPRASDKVAADMRKRTPGPVVPAGFPPPDVSGYGGSRHVVTSREEGAMTAASTLVTECAE